MKHFIPNLQNHPTLNNFKRKPLTGPRTVATGEPFLALQLLDERFVVVGEQLLGPNGGDDIPPLLLSTIVDDGGSCGNGRSRGGCRRGSDGPSLLLLDGHDRGAEDDLRRLVRGRCRLLLLLVLVLLLLLLLDMVDNAVEGGNVVAYGVLDGVTVMGRNGNLRWERCCGNVKGVVAGLDDCGGLGRQGLGNGRGDRSVIARTAGRSVVVVVVVLGVDRFPGFGDFVFHVPVHPEEMLLDVVCPIELLQASIAVEWLFLLVDVFVAGEQISPVRRVRTGGAAVAFSGGRTDSGRAKVGLVLVASGLGNVKGTDGANGSSWGTILRFDLGFLECLL